MKIFIATITVFFLFPSTSHGKENRAWLILSNVNGGIEKIEKESMESCKTEVPRMKSKLRLLGGTSFCVSGK